MPSSSLLLGSRTTLVSVLALFSVFASSVAGQNYVYTLEKEYSGPSFFNEWDFYTGLDPTHGFVDYVDRNTAQQDGLIRFGNDGSAIMAVDSTNTYDPNTPYESVEGYGRPSVRIMTQQSFYHGLIIADIEHMPYGCGTWPAFWALGAANNWPYSGEIDIIEGVNNDQNNVGTLHTGGQCNIAGDSRTMTGTLLNNNCTYDVATGQGAVGCAIQNPDTTSYGSGLDAAGGSVYAVQWTSQAIRMWSFPRSNVPSDITAGTPNPSNWGLPAQTFNGPDCVLDNVIGPQNLIFNIDFCGDYGDAVWSSEGCAAATGYSSCAAYVGANPSAFASAYWQVGSLKYYAQGAAISTTTTTSATTTTTPVTTASPVTTSTTSTLLTGFPMGTTSSSVAVSPVLTVSSFETTYTSVVSLANSSTTAVVVTATGTISLTSSPALPTLSPTFLSPVILTSTEPTNTVSAVITSSSDAVSAVITSISGYGWNNWIEPSELTSAQPQGGFFLPPMGANVPMSVGWNDIQQGQQWAPLSPATLTQSSAPAETGTWIQWPEQEITITQTWIEPCETGYTTKTTIFITEHCGCTETPIPTVPMKVVTTTCPEAWGFTTPVIMTIPNMNVATWSAWPAEATPGNDAAETWPTWQPAAQTSATPPNTWASWESGNNSPIASTGTWTSWNSDEGHNNQPQTPAAETATWTSWAANSANKDQVPAPTSSATWTTISWSALPSPPSPAPAAASTSQLWSNLPGTGVDSAHIAKYTGAATKTTVAAGLLGAVVMVAAFLL